MKVLFTFRWPHARIWRFNFLLAFLLFSFSSLQAQNYVSSNVAIDRLENRTVQLDNQLAQGSISQIDYTLNVKFVTSVLEDGIRGHDFVWSTANSAKITGIYESALQKAQAAFLQTHPQHTNTIISIKEELETLLQQ